LEIGEELGETREMLAVVHLELKVDAFIYPVLVGLPLGCLILGLSRGLSDATHTLVILIVLFFMVVGVGMREALGSENIIEA
jgi:hypothetical protein